MATLHMDVDSCRNVQSQINTIHSQLTSDVATMSTSVQSMVGVLWVGASADQFLTEYENWRASMNQMLDTLTQINTALQSEITQWETVASQLG